MNIQEALQKHLVFRTEYGTGVSMLGGFFKRRTLNRQGYRIDGAREDDVVYEREWKLGPVCVTHRSKNPSLISDDEHELVLTLFRLFAVTNDREMLLKLKAGLGAGVFRTILALHPAGALAEAVDLDVSARAGLRLNLTRFLKQLKEGEASDENELFEDEDIDLS